MLDIDDRISQRQREREGLEDQIPGATSSSLTALRQRIALNAEATANLERRRDVLRNQVMQQLESLVVRERLGSSTETKSSTHLLEINEVPPAGVIRAGMTRAQAEAALPCTSDESTCAARRLFDASGIVVTLGAIPSVIEGPDRNLPSRTEPRRSLFRGQTGKVNVFYRQPVSTRVRVLWLEQRSAGDSTPVLTVLSDDVADVVHPNAHTQYVAFHPRDLASGKLSVAFDPRGRPTVVERQEGASLAVLAGALAEASKAGLETYTSTLSALAGVEEHRRTLQLSDLRTDLARLEAEKARLDARLALDGASATFDQLLRQRELTSELEVVRAELALSEAQVNATLEVELRAMRSELARLREQLEVVRLRQELAQSQAN